MRVAIVHPWFLAGGGAEQVVDTLAKLYPTADIFTLFFEEKSLPPNLKSRNVHALSINWLPAKYKLYRGMFPFYPLMFESIDLRGYDVVITSDSCVAKGILVDQSTVHICYCHSPMRCLWDLYREFKDGFPAVVRPLFTLASHYVRQWDINASQRVDEFVANSRNVAERISKFYHRQSEVIFPPVNTRQGFISSKTDNYYLSVGRLTNVKKVDLLIRACNELGRRFVVAGGGRELARLKSIAGPSIEFVGRVPEVELQNLYANCRALLFAADEDFGIVPVEAQAYGRPVIAYGRGGSLETIIPVGDPSAPEPTGILFADQTVDCIKDAILSFERHESLFSPHAACRNASRFDTSIFSANVLDFVERAAVNSSEGRLQRTRNLAPITSLAASELDTGNLMLANRQACEITVKA